MAFPNYEKMSIEELESARQDLMKKRQEIIAEQLAVVQLIHEKGAVIGAKEKYNKLSNTEKQALHQFLSVPGIVSKEKVGKP